MQNSFKILHRINSPADLKDLSIEELNLVCDELKQYIIDVVEEKGGHFSSPLGVVDLTVALHRVFDAPDDLMIWDVGHQCYPHKILTGRRDQFPTLRQEGGISGFCKRSESEYDAFGAGHASTSISAGVGMAKARDLQGKTHRIISIIGDGAMSGGLAYEGLNNASNINGQFLIVLNDNKMSISPTVGALSHYLTKVVTNPIYNRIRDQIWKLTGKVPAGSTAIRRAFHSLQEGLKSFLVPGMIFEELGLRYFGPIDGHDLNELIETFENLRDFPHPAVVHVLTLKGSGKLQAEADPLKYYSLPDKESVGKKKRKDEAPDYSIVFGKIICDLAKKDEDICCIVAAMREGTGLLDFAKKFPERFFDTGIAEGHAVTFAAGLSISGIKPVVSIYSTFLQRAYDMIIHDVALQNLHVVFTLDRAGVVGPDGPTHHGTFDLAFLQNIPGLVVTAPKDGNEFRDLLYTGLYYYNGPFSIRYPKSSSIRFDPKTQANSLTIGSWDVISPGEEIAVLAVGSMVEQAEVAIGLLNTDTVRPQVINARFIKPLDEKMLSNLMFDFSHIVTVEEGILTGGFGGSVLSWLNAKKYSGTVEIMAIPDEFVDHGNRMKLLDAMNLSGRGIAEKINSILTGKTSGLKLVEAKRLSADQAGRSRTRSVGET